MEEEARVGKETEVVPLGVAQQHRMPGRRQLLRVRGPRRPIRRRCMSRKGRRPVDLGLEAMHSQMLGLLPLPLCLPRARERECVLDTPDLRQNKRERWSVRSRGRCCRLLCAVEPGAWLWRKIHCAIPCACEKYAKYTGVKKRLGGGEEARVSFYFDFSIFRFFIGPMLCEPVFLTEGVGRLRLCRDELVWCGEAFWIGTFISRPARQLAVQAV